MRHFTLYLAVVVCLMAAKMSAQDTFESRAKAIAEKIEKITKEEKEALKIEVEEVNKQLENGSLTITQANEKKQQLAEARATIIENKVAVAQAELNNLVQEKVDGKIKEVSKDRSFTVDWTWSNTNDSIRRSKGESRTTSQLVFATGVNNLVTNGSIANSDFGYLRSVFFEWGLTRNYRLSKNSNLLHLKYGFSWMYNHLHATDNRYFVADGDQTGLATFPTHLRRKDTYFKNVYVTVPLHLEFDFSKTKTDADGNKIFNSHRGFRFGIGGYVGYNTNSKQFLSYEVDGYRINERQKGNWNVNDWNYGLSAYFGRKETSLYIKYDLNPLFKDNLVDQNNISLGIRFDWN
jgi:hypothetical protein